MRRLILTADDFGRSAEVNEAVERAHREGALTAASLMVAEPAFEEAVRIARRNPRLAVGLHLTLADGVPKLDPALLPSLTREGRLRDDMAAVGLLLALSPAAKKELASEVAAQTEGFLATGLALDHVNSHKHFHLHPLIAAALMQAGAGAGARAIRLPWEPQSLVAQADPAGPGAAAEWALKPWCATLRKRAANWNLRAPDRVLGLAWSGQFTADRLLAALPLVPEGVTELYFHPATRGGFPGAAPGYRYAEELAALTDPRVLDALQGTPRGGYAAMLAA